MTEDRRPAFVLDEVSDIGFTRVSAKKADGIPTFVLRNVRNISVRDCSPVANMVVPQAERKDF